MLTACLLALLIAAASVLTGVLLWHKWLRWWEVLLMLPLPLALCLLIYALGFLGATTDHDYVTSWVAKVRYDEAWNEKVTTTETYTDSKGRTRTRTVTRIVEHPPEWRALGAHGGLREISQARYLELVQLWNAVPVRIELHRDYHSRDGDRFEATFPGDDERLMPFATVERYENRVLAAPSVFSYDREPDGPVTAYPGWVHESPPAALGAVRPEESRALDVLNARIGFRHGVRVWVLVVENAPSSRGVDQEVAWKGGHRSDLVVVIGVGPARDVQWCRVFGWTRAETLKVRIRQQITDQTTLDLVSVATWMREHVPAEYVRRDFAEFDYLPVTVPWWVYLLAGLVSIGANAGLMVWLVRNDHHDAEPGESPPGSGRSPWESLRLQRSWRPRGR